MSQALNRLRSIAREQASLYRKTRKKLEQIAQDHYIDADFRTMLIRQEQERARTNLAELKLRMTNAKGAIEKAANARRVAATPEARAKVERAMASGWDIQDLCRQLIAEGDRAGFSALRDALPYMARAGQLPGSPAKMPGAKPDYDKMVRQAFAMVDVLEPQMYDTEERALHDEVRAVGISYPLLEQNAKQLGQWVERQMLSGAYKENIDKMWAWQGLPDDGTQKGSFDPSKEEEVLA